MPSISCQHEVGQYFTEPSNISSVSSLMWSWFLDCQPNQQALVHHICHFVFPVKVSTSNKRRIFRLYKFPGPVKTYNSQELLNIKQLNRDQLRKGQPENGLSVRSPDFVFSASIGWVGPELRQSPNLTAFMSSFTCVSNNLYSCGVAIEAEVKAATSKALCLAARSHWSSLAYLHILERILVTRETADAGDKHTCR